MLGKPALLTEVSVVFFRPSGRRRDSLTIMPDPSKSFPIRRSRYYLALCGTDTEQCHYVIRKRMRGAISPPVSATFSRKRPY
jgi:hypothetical protein